VGPSLFLFLKVLFLTQLLALLGSLDSVAHATSFRDLPKEVEYRESSYICLVESKGSIESPTQDWTASTPIRFNVIDCAKGNLETGSEITVLWPGRSEGKELRRVPGVPPPPQQAEVFILSFSESRFPNTFELKSWKPTAMARGADSEFYEKSSFIELRRGFRNQRDGQAREAQQKPTSWSEIKTKWKEFSKSTNR
jgi:hypothetical protein